MEKQSIFEIFKSGFWTNNTITVQVLGLCPTLAVTNTATNALGLAIATMLVLIVSNITISACRSKIMAQVRIPVFVLVIAALVTTVQILLETFLYSVYATLGIFIPLIVTNCIVIGRAESFAMRNDPLLSFFDAFFTGLGYTAVLLFIGSIREIIGFGTWFQGLDSILGPSFKNFYATVLPEHSTFIIAILPPGAFLVLGLLIAAKNAIDEKQKSRKSEACA